MNKRIENVVISSILINFLSFFTLSKHTADQSKNEISPYYQANTIKRKNPIDSDIEITKLEQKEELEPCYDEYHFSQSGTNVNGPRRSADATKDKYEDNNSFSQATRLDSNLTHSNDYSFSINATLHRNEWLWGLIKREVDEDYFRFDVMGNATIDVTLDNIPQNCDYDIGLYSHDNIAYSGKESISLLSQSRNGSNLSERIRMSAGPGTYYLRVYPYNNTFDAANEYHLYGSFSYSGTAASISNLRFDKGAKGALWVSDYSPFGIAPLSTFGSPEVGVIAYDMSGSVAPLNFEMYDNPYFSYLGRNKQITQTVFYLWDDEWRKEIFNFLSSYEYVLNNIVKENDKLRATIEKREEFINGISTVTGIILSLVDLSKAASISYTILDTVLTDGSAIFAQLLHPQAFDTTQHYLLEHVRYLKNAFERSLNPLTHEVIKVTSSYCIETEEPVGLVQWNYHCNFTPKYDQNGYSTVSDAIPLFTDGTIFHGTTYALRNENDVKLALSKGSQQLSDVNTGGDQKLSLSNFAESTKHLLRGEYHWYHFTVPSTSKYRFYSINSMDTYGELFTSIVPGRSSSGILTSNDDAGENLNFSITYQMVQGQTLYLRIRGFNWSSEGNYTPIVEKMS